MAKTGMLKAGVVAGGQVLDLGAVSGGLDTASEGTSKGRVSFLKPAPSSELTKEINTLKEIHNIDISDLRT